MKDITLGSLFSGIGGFEYVGSIYGIKPLWASEIEAAPIRITQRHFPDMKHLGDVTKIHGDKIDPVDIITFGSPCQDISNAGLKSGISMHCDECCHIINMANYAGERVCPNCGADLDLTRSGLFMDAIRIIREMREKTNESFPKITVWENVSAAISSNNGDDFFVVLKEFCKLLHVKLPPLRPDKWTKCGEILGEHSSIAWRILDAQYWGVPQRRRRIFLVCDFRGQSASEICFKPEMLRRHTAPCEAPWKRFTGKTGKSIDGANTAFRIGSFESNAMKSANPNSGIYQTDLSATLDTSGVNPACNQGGIAIVSDPVYCIQGNSMDRKDENGCTGKGWSEDVCYTLNTVDRPAVVQTITKSVIDNNMSDVRYNIVPNNIVPTLKARMGTGWNNTPLILEETSQQSESVLIEAYQHHGYRESDTCGTLTAGLCKGVRGDTPLVIQNPVIIGNGQTCQMSESTVARTLDCMHDQQIVVQDIAAVDCRNGVEIADVNDTLQANTGTNNNNIVRVKSLIRRLTPLEAERLQGFEDEWTAGESDSARYKALGNSVALPCVDYIFSGIMDALNPEC